MNVHEWKVTQPMKYVGFGFGFLVLVIPGLLFVVPSLIPSDVYKSRIEEQLSRELSRDITIEGDVSLSTFPVIRARTGAASIANPPGFGRETLASLQSLEARIKLLPLLSRRVEIASFTLVEPDIWLEKRADGQTNWDFPAEDDADAPSDETPFQRDGRYGDIDPSLGSFRVENGRLTYIDNTASLRRVATDMDVRLSMTSMSDLFDVSGSMTLDESPVEIDLKLDSPRDFLDGRETRLDATLKLNGLSASANGIIPAGLDLGFNGMVEADISDFSLLKPFLEEPIPTLDLLETVQLSANLAQQTSEAPLAINNLKLDAKGDGMTASLSGSFTLQNNAVSGSGAFDADIANAGPKARAIVKDLPADIDLLGRVTASGKLTLQDNDISIRELTTETESDGAQSQYSGTLSILGSQVSLNGTLSATVPSLAQISRNRSDPIPYGTLIETLSLSAKADGTLDNLNLNDLVIDLSNGDLNGSYTGSARLSEVTSLNGRLDVNSPSLRRIAKESGTELPGAQGEDVIFEAFSLTGDVSGSTQTMSLTGAILKLDRFQAEGEFNVALAEKRPSLTGQLATETLDLRPYMNAYTADRPAGEIQPWSTDPIPVEGLSAIDADIDLSANAIQLPQLTLGETQASVDLKDGVMTVTVPTMTLYGGRGQGVFVLDGSTETPKISITAGLNRLQTNSFLSALAGFTQTSGVGQTRVTLDGSGLSQAAIMQSLTGDGTFGISDGTISGIDAAQFMTGLQSALTSRSLPSGIGPGQKTEFKDLIGGFSLRNGVAEIQSFSLSGSQIQMDGSGRVDLGEQTVDIRLQPKAVGEQARGLAAFGIPLRIQGPFGASTASLDSEMLADILQARAAEEARKAITDRVGGPVGGVLGSILGGSSPSSPRNPASQKADPESESSEEAEPETPEDAIENGLRQLFGVKRKD